MCFHVNLNLWEFFQIGIRVVSTNGTTCKYHHRSEQATIKRHSGTQSYLEEQSVVSDLRFIGRRLLSR